MRPRTLVHPNYGTFTAWTTTPAADKPEQVNLPVLIFFYYYPTQLHWILSLLLWSIQAAILLPCLLPLQTSASAFSQLQRQYYGPLQIVDAGNSSLNCTLPLALNISKPLNLLVASLPAASGGAAPGQSSA
ncbi:hypothetical protein PCANC_25366 [Puccinia coronata f. sp. avenae]|uniref:Uncharacterized protein n=1 Tax=Puccinia coronata f. sp. avenae TaxID=200324 RepID=A0A2N5TU04_9BASI|nr:hypothetical protein PCANC_25366 [Puccinia coronata f. sp. avenae]